MAQAKKKAASRNTTKRSAKTSKTRRVTATGHADDQAKTLVAWAVLGLVVVAFAMWILTNYKDLQENFNNVDEGSSAVPTVQKRP